MIKELLRVQIPEDTSRGMGDYRNLIDQAKAPLFDRAREMGFVPYGAYREHNGLGGVYSTWSEPGHEEDLLPTDFLIVDAGLFILPREAALTEHLIEFPVTTLEEFAIAMESVQAFVDHNTDKLQSRLSRSLRVEPDMHEFLSRLAGTPPRELPPMNTWDRFPSRRDSRFNWLKIGTEEK